MERFLHAVFFVFSLQFGSISAYDDATLLQVVNATPGGDMGLTDERINQRFYSGRAEGTLWEFTCDGMTDECHDALAQCRVQKSHEVHPPCSGRQTPRGTVWLLTTNAFLPRRAHMSYPQTEGAGVGPVLRSICGAENSEQNGCMGPGCDGGWTDAVAPTRNAAQNANLDWTDGVRDGQYTEPNQQGNGFNVYVADTGVNCYHTDLIGRCEKVNDQFDSNRGPTCKGRSRRCAADKHGHGTHCAGTVGGTAVGVARGTRIGAVKVLSDSGSGSTAGVINGINAAVAHCGSGNQCVLSMSLGGPGTSQAYVDAIDAALADGVITVVAAGNSNDDACNYRPAHVPSAVTVGSTADTGSTTTVTMSYFSNYGTCIDVWAVGSSVNSLSYSSKTSNATMSGTSMACPAVAGAMAVILGWGYSGQAAINYMTNTALSGIINSIPSSPPSPNLHMRLVQPSR